MFVAETMKRCTTMGRAQALAAVWQVIEQLDAAGDLPEVAQTLVDGTTAANLTDRQKRVILTSDSLATSAPFPSCTAAPCMAAMLGPFA